ncbi:MAG: threonine--tRNA ligase [Candidatus Pacebacteria bacterium]|nr:threonine--tRNA ligase [Candidatus Paceibacterota bacterium]
MASLEEKRHTFAHLLAAAVQERYPHALPTIGPATETGFYYDFDFSKGDAPGEADLKDIEESMRDLLTDWTDMTGVEVSADDALGRYTQNPYKTELIRDIVARDEVITLYTAGNFTDLCRGGHAEHPARELLKDSFSLERLAGAYWKGDESNAMLTRIYGLAFDTLEELEAYKAQQEEAKKRDHRILGEKLDLFHFDEAIGKGLPIWLPKGNIIKEELEAWAKETERAWGYDRVTTPIITKEDLFYTSGHLPLYKDSMYAPIQIEDANFYIKPMNCPFHHKAFAARPKSYRDLPVRLAEYGWCHRYEDSGSLFGLMRVRGMQMNDAHIYVSREEAVHEFVQVIKLHEYFYKTLGIENYEMELALRDPENMEKYHGDEEDWKDAESMTREAMEQSGVPYKVVNEGAAFYGPKMDFQIYSSIGRSFTASTNQLDLFMGKRFSLEYTDKDGSKKVPAIIHRAPLGTHERFIGFLIEHFAGAFPTWLAPVQVRILPVSDKHHTYGKEVKDALYAAGVRVEFDDASESLGKKIRASKTEKIPYMIVLGDKEVEANALTVEKRNGEKLENVTIAHFVELITKEIKDRALS